MEKYVEHILNAERKIFVADHILYVSYPLIKDNRLLIKTLSEIAQSIDRMILAFLTYEYFYKRISNIPNENERMRIFLRCSKKILDDKDIEAIKEISLICNKHASSPLEFVRRDKFVIMSDNLSVTTLTQEKIKKLNECAKLIISKVKRYLGISKLNNYTI